MAMTSRSVAIAAQAELLRFLIQHADAKPHPFLNERADVVDAAFAIVEENARSRLGFGDTDCRGPVRIDANAMQRGRQIPVGIALHRRGHHEKREQQEDTIDQRRDVNVGLEGFALFGPPVLLGRIARKDRASRHTDFPFAGRNAASYISRNVPSWCWTAFCNMPSRTWIILPASVSGMAIARPKAVVNRACPMSP